MKPGPMTTCGSLSTGRNCTPGSGSGSRVVELQKALSDRVRDLEAALARVKTLQGLVPICCYCKKIRNDQNYWEQLETYLSEHSEAEFSHGICPDCMQKHIALKSLRLRFRKIRKRPKRILRRGIFLKMILFAFLFFLGV